MLDALHMSLALPPVRALHWLGSDLPVEKGVQVVNQNWVLGRFLGLRCFLARIRACVAAHVLDAMQCRHR